MSAGKLILGTAQLGMPYGINNLAGKPNETEAHAILDVAWDAGIRLLDTAAAYGDAQTVIGQWHRRNAGRRFDVISKFSAEHGTAGPREAIEEMIGTLGVDHLWGLLHHRPGEFRAQPSMLHEMCELRDRQLVNHIGVSVYANEDAGTFSDVPQLDLIQLPFNLLDNWRQRGATITGAAGHGKIVHTRSVFLQGLLFKKPDSFPAALRPLQKHIARLEGIARDFGLDMGAMALGYALRQELVSGVLIGVDSAAQLKKNIADSAREIPNDALDAIDGVVVLETALLSPANWGRA